MSNAQWRPWPALVTFLFLLLAVTALPALAMGIPQIQYMTNDQFIEQAFEGKQPQWKMLRLNGGLRKEVEEILTHPYAGSRLRYWVAGQRTAWIIDEIGKEMPITIGVVVEGDTIEDVKILVYREERGGEVHQDFFTRQFRQVTLTESGGLSKNIDGITGATLSVGSVSRVANLVLVMHRVVMDKPAQ